VAGFVPAIYAFLPSSGCSCGHVDGRIKSGHDRLDERSRQ